VSLPQNSIKHQCNHCSKVSSSSVEWEFCGKKNCCSHSIYNRN
jgi:hypothetical protein